MKDNQILIGYSIRSLTKDKSWTVKRRNRFLINPNIALPKSVSNVIWEMVDDFIDFDDEELFWGSYGFQDVNQLLSLSGYQKEQQDRVVVCACVHYLFFVPTFVWALNMLPYYGDENFYFLGYDIADSSMMSGLSNCSYSTDDLEYCQKIFLPFLNKHGLFDDFDIALEFLHYTNNRVRDHAPFYIYSLYSDKNI